MSDSEDAGRQGQVCGFGSLRATRLVRTPRGGRLPKELVVRDDLWTRVAQVVKR